MSDVTISVDWHAVEADFTPFLGGDPTVMDHRYVIDRVRVQIDLAHDLLATPHRVEAWGVQATLSGQRRRNGQMTLVYLSREDEERWRRRAIDEIGARGEALYRMLEVVSR